MWVGEGLLWSKNGSRIVITQASVSISRLLSIFYTFYFFFTGFFETHTMLLMNRKETTFCLSEPRRLRLFSRNTDPKGFCACVVFLYTILPNTILVPVNVSHASYLLMRRRVNSRVPPDTDRVMMLGEAKVVLVVLGEVYLK